MQTDILLKQLHNSLAELKTTIDKFEKHPSPSTHYAENLHLAIHQSNKLVSAYLVLKEHNDVSPDLNLHLKLMNEPTAEQFKPIIEPIMGSIVIEPIVEVKEPVNKIEQFIEPVIEPIVEVVEVKVVKKEFPKIAITINDKFRIINELFESNATEYNIAIEQINAVNSKIELDSYLKGLQTIYNWNDDNEVVKNLWAIAQKRFI
jgi:hypothetical protein